MHVTHHGQLSLCNGRQHSPRAVLLKHREIVRRCKSSFPEVFAPWRSTGWTALGTLGKGCGADAAAFSAATGHQAVLSDSKYTQRLMSRESDTSNEGRNEIDGEASAISQREASHAEASTSGAWDLPTACA